MSIPPETIVRGAQRWLQLIPVSGVNRARALLSTAREYADLTPTQYAESLEWVQRTKLLGPESKATQIAAAPERLLEAIILGGSPAWLQDADILIQDTAEIPDDALSAGEALGVSPSATLACIRRAWGKVDIAARERVGAAGEAEILRHLDTLAAGVTVDHVASWSDAHGYDIAVAKSNRECHLEVKATTRENRLTLHLSRNEYETMRLDTAWQLVIVVLDQTLQLARVYSVMREWVDSCAPIDVVVGARWDSARFDVPASACTLGIAALSPFLRDQGSPLLVGAQL